jgi:ABC-type transporter Mla subunit MlaD
MRTTPVNILGNEVGHVHSVKLNEGGYVDVVLRVKRRFSHFIHNDSKATIKQKNFVFGDWEVDLTMGNKSSPPIKTGDTLEVDYPIRLDKMVAQLTKMMAPMEDIFQSIASGEGILKHILGGDTLMPKTTEVLNRINSMFGEVDYTIDKANVMIERLTDFSEHGNATIDSIVSLFGSVEGLIAKIDGVVVNIDSLIAGFGTLPEDAGTILNLLQKDLLEADVLFKGVQNHWLLRRTIRKQKEMQEKELQNKE